MPSVRSRRVPLNTWGWICQAALRPSLLIIVAVVTAFSTYVSLAEWGGYNLNDGEMISAAVVSTVVFFAASGAGYGAWLGVDNARSGVRRLEMSRVRQRAGAPLARIAGACATFAIGVAVTWAINAVVSLTQDYRTDSISVVLALYAICASSAMVPLGYAAGIAIPHLLTIPAVTIITWFAITLADSYSVVGTLIPHYSIEIGVFAVWNMSVWIGSALWLASMGALIAAAVGLLPFVRSRWIVMCSAAGIAVLGVALIARADFELYDWEADRAQDGQDVRAAVCEGTDPEVCLPAAYEAVRAPLTESLRTLTERIEPLPGEYTRFELRPRGRGQEPREGTTAIHMDSATPDTIPFVLEEWIDYELLDFDACYSDQAIENRDLAVTVMAWLAGSTASAEQSGEPVRQPVTTFSQWSEEQRRAWFSKNWPKFASCTLTPGDFS